MDRSHLLAEITELSREFGQFAYVRGGGGNTSCKDDETLYIKPSGITLAEMVPEKFLALSRKKIDLLYDQAFPSGEQAREAAVVTFMTETILPGQDGRPSVEAPLHNCFLQRYVVHTHPAVVNGMTCGRDGAEACARLFPNAMWLPVIEPGYIVSVCVHAEMQNYIDSHGKPPEMIFLANHGLFIAHDEADGIRALYREAMEKTGAEVEKAGLSGEPEQGPDPKPEVVRDVMEVLRRVIGEDAACYSVRPHFALPGGAISPDHIVYCKADLYEGDASEESLRAFRDRVGYWPRVVSIPGAVIGLGASQRVADLASELAWDGALVVRYAGAFGGIRYMDERFVRFIQDWEVESYRQKMAK